MQLEKKTTLRYEKEKEGNIKKYILSIKKKEIRQANTINRIYI